MSTPPSPAQLASETPASRGVGISLGGISKTFPGGIEAVRPMDLQFAAGDFVAILGPSGCGKSTLLRIIAGLEKPSTGSVQFDLKSSRPRIAYVFQDAHLLPWRSVLKNVMLPLELMHVPRADRRARALEAIEWVGLSDAMTRVPGQLSGGMKMRVSLARALVTEPDVMLLDEPFAALDEITRHQLDGQLRKLWNDHRMTTLFVTHSTGEAAFLANRAIVMTRRPARVALDIPIDLPHDRTDVVRNSPELLDCTRRMFEALHAPPERQS
jgi:NitT/TauT family transport system ATP-binding protein